MQCYVVLNFKAEYKPPFNNIFKEGELDRNSVVKDSLTTAYDGKKYKTKFYFNPNF